MKNIPLSQSSNNKSLCCQYCKTEFFNLEQKSKCIKCQSITKKSVKKNILEEEDEDIIGFSNKEVTQNLNKENYKEIENYLDDLVKQQYDEFDCFYDDEDNFA